MKKINEFLINNIKTLDDRTLFRFAASMINMYNEKWEICDVMFDTTFDLYKPKMRKEDIYEFFNSICDDLNDKKLDCNYDAESHVENMLGVKFIRLNNGKPKPQ